MIRGRVSYSGPPLPIAQRAAKQKEPHYKDRINSESVAPKIIQNQIQGEPRELFHNLYGDHKRLRFSHLTYDRTSTRIGHDLRGLGAFFGKQLEGIERLASSSKLLHPLQ